MTYVTGTGKCGLILKICDRTICSYTDVVPSLFIECNHLTQAERERDFYVNGKNLFSLPQAQDGSTFLLSVMFALLVFFCDGNQVYFVFSNMLQGVQRTITKL